MRKKGIAILLVVAALFCLWAFLLSDRWLEKRLESLAGNIVGARVELEKFDFSLFGMRIQWARLSVADPDDTWRNLLETGYCTLDLDSAPLFKGKFIIEDMRLLDLRFDTERETDGSLPEKRRKKGPAKIGTFFQDRLEKKLSELPVFDENTLAESIDTEKLWLGLSPDSPGRIDRLVKEYELFASETGERLRGLEIEKELAAVRSELDEIDVGSLETVEQLKDATERLNRIAEKTKGAGEKLDSEGDEYSEKIERLNRESAAVQEWIEEDMESIQDAIRIPEITLENVAIVMFGPKLVERVRKVLRIIEKFRAITAKIRKFVPIKQIPPRLRGQDISFARGKSLPNLWLKHISFSGYTKDDIRIAGTLRDLTSGQHLTGRPTLLEVEGGTGGEQNFVLEGSFDSRGEVPRDSLAFEMQNIVIQNMHLTDFPLLPNTLENGNASLRAELAFIGQELRSSIFFEIEDVLLKLPEKEAASPVEERLFLVSRSIAEDIREIGIEADLEILSDRTLFAVRSTLDSIVAGKIDEVLQKEVDGVKQELLRRMQGVTDESKRELDRVIEASEDAVLAKIEDLEKAKKSLETEISRKKRKIEERIREETVKELEDEKRKKEEELLKDLEVPSEPEIPKDIEKGLEGLF